MSKFFKSDADRELWIELNAKHQIEWEKKLTWFNPKTGKDEPTNQALNPRSMDAAIKVAKNQLEYDEKQGVLRHTLEDYQTKTYEELRSAGNAHKAEIIKCLGNPGIMGYCKDSEYNDFLKQLDERGHFHDLDRTGGKIKKVKFKDFEYSYEINESDFSHTTFYEDDDVVFVWCVEKKYLKEKV